MSRKQLSPEELDAMIVRSLSRLPAFGPSRSFGDKVMDRVQLPSPGPVVALRRARRWLAQPRRALVFASGYALVAGVALVLFVPWLMANIPALSLAYDWTMSRAGAVLRDIALGSASWAISSGLTGLLESVPRSGMQAWALAFGAAASYAGCAVGLHYLLRTPRGKHAPIQIQS